MSTARRLHHTHADYVRLERDSPIKHEYCDGEIYAMAGGTAAHGALAAAVISSFGAQLPAGWRALTSDVRVRIEASDLSTYPDALVICGAASYDAIDTHKQLPSLKAVVIVSHKTRRVTVHSRAGTWETREFRPGETAIITEPALKLEVDRLYAVLEGL